MTVKRGIAIRRARASAGLSQEALEDRAGVSQTLISAMENGHCPQSVRAAIRLARALGTTVEVLWGDFAAEPSPGRGRRRVYKGATSTTAAATEAA